jgi:hypothetical protein
MGEGHEDEGPANASGEETDPYVIWLLTSDLGPFIARYGPRPRRRVPGPNGWQKAHRIKTQEFA